MTVLVAGCATAHVDHVILAIRDLDEGVRQFEAETGVRAVVGGEHPGGGTKNALVSLGPETYLEILAPTTRGAIAELDRLDKLAPIGFAVFAEELKAMRNRLAHEGIRTTEPVAGSRVLPSGAKLTWSTFEVPENDSAPFFIHWDDLEKHPAKTSPVGCSLVAIEGSEVGHRLRVARSSSGPLTVTIRCKGREIRFRGNG